MPRPSKSRQPAAPQSLTAGTYRPDTPRSPQHRIFVTWADGTRSTVYVNHERYLELLALADNNTSLLHSSVSYVARTLTPTALGSRSAQALDAAEQLLLLQRAAYNRAARAAASANNKFWETAND